MAGARRRAARLERGSDAHYEDPRYYAAAYASRRDDVDYYVELALVHARRRRCHVLEYGCGNGRIALAIARSGVQVTGIDRSRHMLADLETRLSLETPSVRGRLTLRRGDMRSASFSKRFDLVLCTFNTFLHLYTRRDVERFCARVRRHLALRGRFVFDVSLPETSELALDPERPYRTPRFRHPSTGEVVRYAERFDYDPLSQVLTVNMEFEPLSKPSRRWVTPLAHRQFFPQELEALLHYNGLVVTDIHADYHRRAPNRESETLIYHCARRR